ncbi:MAG: hypothetical protein ACFCUR_02160 [Rhodomicrobiaceae bacterium]
MRRVIAAIFTLGLGLTIAGLMPATASAAPQSLPALSLSELSAKLSPVSKASYRHYCVRQYFKCRDRWGSGWRFRRCMEGRDCWEAYLDYRDRRSQGGHYNSCGKWKAACAENWGYGNNDYYGCLRYHGCD